MGLLSDPTFLLLDNPTNHLEIETREVIEEALRNYNGAMLISSHDRYFLEQVDVNKTISLDSNSS
jgi:ATP-binding cassette subfamily F protein 3